MADGAKESQARATVIAAFAGFIGVIVGGVITAYIQWEVAKITVESQKSVAQIAAQSQENMAKLIAQVQQETARAAIIQHATKDGSSIQNLLFWKKIGMLQISLSDAELERLVTACISPRSNLDTCRPALK